MDASGRMRVVLYAAAEIRGGLLGHVATLAGGLAAAGHSVRLVLSSAPALDPLAREVSDSGVALTRMRVRGKGDLTGFLRLRRFVARENPDIVHLHLASPIESVPALLAARLGGARHIVTTEHAPAWFPLIRPYSRAVKRAATRLVGAVIAVSDSDADVLRGTFAVPDALIKVIPNGIPPLGDLPRRDEARDRIGLPGAATIVGYLGPLEEKKGLRDLLAGAAQSGLPGLALALVGQGSLREELAREAARLRLHLVLPGHMDDVRMALAAFDIFAFPSHQEAMGRALLEAMAAGLPIVAARVGGIPEALQNGAAGLLVEPRRPDQIAAALGRLARDHDLAGRLGAAARATAERDYGADLMVRRITALYRRLLETEISA